MYAMEGKLLSRAPTNICNLGKAVINLKTLTILTNRKTMTIEALTGKINSDSDITTIAKSNIFQESLK